MKIHELKSAPGARKDKIRRGRGDASGKGSFSGRGCKGQNARSGGGVRIGFEGGQTPLMRRIPKLKGFRSPCKEVFTPCNLTKIDEAYKAGETVSSETLVAKRVISKKNLMVKILSMGELSKALTFDGVAFSATAKAKIEKAGGKITNELVAKPKKAEVKEKITKSKK